MKYDFDAPVDRRGTDSLKWDGMRRYYGREDLMPFWVADMDFRTPPFILEALRERLSHEVLGYSVKSEAYFGSIVQWARERYGWAVEAKWIHFMSGVVPGLALAMQYFTREGDKILVMPPIYHPFHLLPTHNGREVVWSALDYEDGVYCFNVARFREDVKGCKLFFLCNPHNPAGKVWTTDELRLMAAICAEEGVVVCSDEIHADLTFAPHKHTPFATVSEAARMNSITYQAPSKAFNIPGMASAHCLIPNSSLRRGFYAYLDSNELADGTALAWRATTAAYTHGAEWLGQMLDYVWGNIQMVAQFCQQEMPQIRPVLPEASYLVFLDCRALGLSQSELEHFFCATAGVALNSGTIFGKEGAGFMRLNCGCPRAYLRQGLERIAAAINKNSKFACGM